MQEAIERRNPEQTRVPLEDLLVELRPEGFDEAFEADGVDLGVGGLAMRAAILPDVGSRLQCRFQSIALLQQLGAIDACFAGGNLVRRQIVKLQSRRRHGNSTVGDRRVLWPDSSD